MKGSRQKKTESNGEQKTDTSFQVIVLVRNIFEKIWFARIDVGSFAPCAAIRDSHTAAETSLLCFVVS